MSPRGIWHGHAIYIMSNQQIIDIISTRIYSMLAWRIIKYKQFLVSFQQFQSLHEGKGKAVML